MGLGDMLKNLFAYKEPKKYDRFELLEDGVEDNSQVKPDKKDTAAQDVPETKQKSNNKDKVSKKLQTNLEKIKNKLNYPTSRDVIIREFKILQQSDAFIVYIDGMVDNNIVNDYILRQLLRKHNTDTGTKINVPDYITDNLLAANQVTTESDYTEIIEQVLNGMTALFIDKSDQCILIKSRGFEKRAVSQPVNETVILGPHEAFIENLHTNITLIRRIIRNKDLVAETIPVGNVNNVTCAILYIKGITNPKIIREVKRRINSIDIDFVSSDGTLDQLIEDHPLAIFPQILSTERPDRTASFLMEGRVAIIVDGAPNASIVPATFFDMMHTSEDYSLRWQYGTFMRIIRVISAALATFLPGFYLALTLYHHEMIPTELLASLAKARENIPFPIIVEILLMEISWELIREAGIRMPGVMGQTLGIIGAVILGEAVIAAELVSPILIIIVAITGLANLVIPNYPLGFGIRILRFVFVLLGAMAGFYGIATGIFIFGGLACSMKSFGVPYLSPVAPRAKASPDIIPRMPIWLQKERPDIINPKQRRRSRGIIRGWVKQDGREDKPQ
ncbi:MAG: spore germination protein [Natronincolaceae bacterium]|jgi:spore germination protein KA|nr:spore germination protein [Bacillota bacterium]